MEPYFICCLILLTSFVEVHSETKEVSRGETVLLFANVSADSPDNEVHLYINGKKDNTLLASWKFETAGFKTVSKTYHNIVMDVDRNILIYNVNENYTGKYSLYNSSRPAIELIVHGNSQINWENPSQNILLWIVGISLTFALPASAFFLFVAYRKWGKKIRPCHKCRHGKHQTPKEPGEDTELVRSENPQYEEEIKKALCPLLEIMKNQDVVIQELAKKAKVEEQRVKEEEEEYSKMRKRIADLDANVETVKDQLVRSENPQYEEKIKKALCPLLEIMKNQDVVIQELAKKAKVEEQRVKEEEEEYSKMRKRIADLDANVETVKDQLVRSENPQYEEKIKKALCPLLEIMKNQDVVIQELAKKAKVKEQRVKEEEAKYSKMRKRIANLDANVETVKDQLAKVEMQRVKEEDMKYSHMMKTMADKFEELRMLITKKDSEIERRRNNNTYVESSLISSFSNLINGTMDKMMPGSPMIATKTPTSENLSDS